MQGGYVLEGSLVAIGLPYPHHPSHLHPVCADFHSFIIMFVGNIASV